MSSAGFMKRLIRSLGSIQLGISLIAALAVASIWGSLIAADPKQGVDHAIVKVFSAPWFLTLIGLLALNLILCSWDKTLQALGLFRRASFPPSSAFFTRLPYAVEVVVPTDPDKIEQTLKRHFRVTRRDGNRFYAQKGVASRFGFMIVHVGLLLVIGAAMFRGLAGLLGWGLYDASLIVAEGQTTRHYYTRKDRLAPANAANLQPHPLPFPFQVLDFTAEHYPNSSVVRSFRCLVEAGEGDQRQMAEISMAEPYYFRGFKITLNSYSEHPQLRRDVYRVVDKQSGQAADIDAGKNTPVRLPFPSQNESLFLEIRQEKDTTHYRVLDLDRHMILEQGPVTLSSAVSMQERAKSLSERIRSLPRVLIILGIFGSSAQIAKVPTLSSSTEKTTEGKGLLLAYFEAGKFASQQWLAERDPTSPLAATGVLLAVDNISTSPGEAELQRDYRAKLVATLSGASDAPAEVFVTAGDVVELRTTPTLSLRLVGTSSEDVEASSESWGAPTEKSHLTSTPPPEKRFRVVATGTTKPAQTIFLGIMYDPAIPFFYVGCFVILFGIVLAFAQVYREIWLLWEPSTTRLYVGMAFRRRTSSRALGEFRQLIEELSRNVRSGTEPVVIAPKEVA